jgi:hypothetical protein
MTSPGVDRLRVDLDELRGATVQWKSDAAGLGTAAPPPVTTPQWPTGIATSGMHGATAEHVAEMQAKMTGTSAWMDGAGDQFGHGDKEAAFKLADVAALISAGTSPLGNLASAGGSMFGQLFSTAGNFGSQLMQAMLKAQGGQGNADGQHDQHDGQHGSVHDHDHYMNGGQQW